MTAKSDQEFAASHHLLAIEPNVEVATDAVDVCFGNPVGASVFGVGMTKSDVDPRNFLVLQNVSNDVPASGVGADGEFADAIAVLVRACISAKFVAQILVLRFQGADAIILYLDGERAGFQIAIAFAKIIANHAINNEDAVSIERRGENFASGQVAPFVFRDNSAGFEPFQFRGKLSLEFGAVRCLARNPFSFARALDQALTQGVDFHKIGAHTLQHDFAVNVDHMTVPNLVFVDDAGHLRARAEARPSGVCAAKIDTCERARSSRISSGMYFSGRRAWCSSTNRL